MKKTLILLVVYYLGGKISYACIFPDTSIKTDENKGAVLAKDIEKNSNIAYYDYETQEVKVGTVSDIYIHKKATDFVRYEFEDGTFLEATDYHPIYTKEGWKSLIRINGYEKPQEGDEVKTDTGWKQITKIKTWIGLEDCYDFAVIDKEGNKINNYFANDTLVQSSI